MLIFKDVFHLAADEADRGTTLHSTGPTTASTGVLQWKSAASSQNHMPNFVNRGLKVSELTELTEQKIQKGPAKHFGWWCQDVSGQSDGNLPVEPSNRWKSIYQTESISPIPLGFTKHHEDLGKTKPETKLLRSNSETPRGC